LSGTTRWNTPSCRAAAQSTTTRPGTVKRTPPEAEELFGPVSAKLFKGLTWRLPLHTNGYGPVFKGFCDAPNAGKRDRCPGGEAPGFVFVAIASDGASIPAVPGVDDVPNVLVQGPKRVEFIQQERRPFRLNHPEHPLQAEATRKLAVAFLEGGRQGVAALALERVAAYAAEDADVTLTLADTFTCVPVNAVLVELTVVLAPVALTLDVISSVPPDRVKLALLTTAFVVLT
jgi:hypothetical protein